MSYEYDMELGKRDRVTVIRECVNRDVRGIWHDKECLNHHRPKSEVKKSLPHCLP